ncbi:LRIT1 [Branchiostoma lanceolatum]|uniref:LRIT1 protein n=1 Tax=Branchiostoma lanceolatum TaxID=7740 RepID=A0A8K0AAK9_BRALA|nr:LRIT1 [Branchiostoma lanceolatum]
MPRLTHLVLSYNRLKVFPWSSLRNTPHITNLDLDNNEISRVDAYVDFPRSLTYLSLHSNHIATIPETFLSGAKPPENIFYLGIWQNPFRCDCEIQWIARARRCVWEHRNDGCVNASPERVKTCMLANCNFHPSGVVVVLDVPENRYISGLIHTYVLKCHSPRELKGKYLRDSTLPTCPSPTTSMVASSTSSENVQGKESPSSSTAGTQWFENEESQEEKKELRVTFSGQMTTVSTLKAPLTRFWQAFTAIVLAAILAVLVVVNFSLRCRAFVRRRRGNADGLHRASRRENTAALRRQRSREDGEEETAL